MCISQSNSYRNTTHSSCTWHTLSWCNRQCITMLWTQQWTSSASLYGGCTVCISNCIGFYTTHTWYQTRWADSSTVHILSFTICQTWNSCNEWSVFSTVEFLHKSHFLIDIFTFSFSTTYWISSSSFLYSTWTWHNTSTHTLTFWFSVRSVSSFFSFFWLSHIFSFDICFSASNVGRIFSFFIREVGFKYILNALDMHVVSSHSNFVNQNKLVVFVCSNPSLLSFCWHISILPSQYNQTHDRKWKDHNSKIWCSEWWNRHIFSCCYCYQHIYSHATKKFLSSHCMLIFFVRFSIVFDFFEKQTLFHECLIETAC